MDQVVDVVEALLSANARNEGPYLRLDVCTRSAPLDLVLLQVTNLISIIAERGGPVSARRRPVFEAE